MPGPEPLLPAQSGTGTRPGTAAPLSGHRHRGPTGAAPRPHWAAPGAPAADWPCRPSVRGTAGPTCASSAPTAAATSPARLRARAAPGGRGCAGLAAGTGGQAQGRSLGREAEPAAAPTPARAALTSVVVAGSDVRGRGAREAEGPVGSGGGRFGLCPERLRGPAALPRERRRSHCAGERQRRSGRGVCPRRAGRLPARGSLSPRGRRALGRARSPAVVGARKGVWGAGPGPTLATSPLRAGSGTAARLACLGWDTVFSRWCPGQPGQDAQSLVQVASAPRVAQLARPPRPELGGDTFASLPNGAISRGSPPYAAGECRFRINQNSSCWAFQRRLQC